MPTALKTTCAFVTLILAVLAVGTSALAHGNGVDVGYAHLMATESDGLVIIEVEVLEPQPCDVFEPDWITGQRGEAMVSAPLEADGPCRFKGAIELPEAGRWVVTTWLQFDGSLADASIIVGVGTDIDLFETESLIHAEIDEPESSLFSGNLLSYTLYGVVAVAAAALVIYAVHRSRRDAEDVPPAIPDR